MTDGNITFARIRERAHELWERNHRPDGLDVEFWLAAERELRAEHQRATEATGPRSRPAVGQES